LKTRKPDYVNSAIPNAKFKIRNPKF